MPILRYDWQSADKAGYREHPLKVMQQLGYTVLNNEPVGIADCTFFEVETIIEPLPSFLQIAHPDFKFTE